MKLGFLNWAHTVFPLKVIMPIYFSSFFFIDRISRYHFSELSAGIVG
jgi:hypothetical protein